MNNILFTSLQVVIALLVVYILGVFAMKIMTKEDIIMDPTKLTITPIFTGWIETNGFINKQFNTFNRFAKNFRNLPHSMNRYGGAQFSYSLWIKLNNTSAENVADKILFLHGDPKMYKYRVYTNEGSKTLTDYITKCPLVKFGNSVDDIKVQFNTTNDISATSTISRIPNADETVRHNIVSLIPGKWAFFTFVFEDDKRYNEFEDGVIFRFYINDILYHTERYKGAIRLNKGHLHILPTGSIKDGYLADLTYYNYALNINEIRTLYAKGHNNTRYNELENDASFNEPMYLSQYNKLEINNF